jgi:hypothetical protein
VAFRLIGFCLFLSACTNQQDKDRIAQLEKQNQLLESQVKQQREAANLDLQDRCAKQSTAEFAAKWKTNGEDGSFNTYTNHYNARLKKCFMSVVGSTISRGGRGVITSTTLVDAFESKVYGECYRRQDGIPIVCRRIGYADLVEFPTVALFDDFVKPFMTD